MIRGEARAGRSGADATGKPRPTFVLISLVATFAAALGCQSEVDPSAISASVIGYGTFEIRGGLPTLTATTSTIDCEPGRTFGVDYRIEVGKGERGRVPVEFRWIHPELAVPSRRLWGTESPARPSSPELEWQQTRIDGRVLWTLEHPDELVSGRYEFQIRRLSDGAVLLSRSFDVQGC